MRIYYYGFILRLQKDAAFQGWIKKFLMGYDRLKPTSDGKVIFPLLSYPTVTLPAV